MLPLIRTLDVLEDSLARLSSINRLQREGRPVWEKVGEVCVTAYKNQNHLKCMFQLGMNKRNKRRKERSRGG